MVSLALALSQYSLISAYSLILGTPTLWQDFFFLKIEKKSK